MGKCQLSIRTGSVTMNSRLRVVLFLIDLFVAVTAGAGGLALVAGLEAMRFPLEKLPN